MRISGLLPLQPFVHLLWIINLGFVAADAWELHRSILVLRTWTGLWGLELDLAKTYVWSSSCEGQRSLRPLGFRIAEADRDLGAQLVYGAHHRVQHQLRRFDDLAALWKKLRQVAAPEVCAWTVLQQCFWQRAFYAVSICLPGWEHVRKLRAEAMKALYTLQASWCFCPSALDPGFSFQFWSVLSAFRRMARKHPFVMVEWERYMSGYQGSATHGPFGKLPEQCRLVSWAVEGALLIGPGRMARTCLRRSESPPRHPRSLWFG